MTLRADTALALLCAREDVGSDPDGTPRPERVARLRERCSAIDDWSALIDRVDRLLVLPLVHRHLRTHADDLVPEEAMRTLAARSRRWVVRNLQVADVHLRLTRDVLTPIGVPHVFVKGTTLAHRFYREPNLRIARDVDVLVPRTALETVGRRLRDLGHRALHAQLDSDDGIRYSARVLGDSAWVSPDGVLIEVHARLKLGAGRLATSRLLEDPAHVTVAGVPLPALQEPDAIAHLCLHHSWSGYDRLHWIADLDAVLRATGAEEERIIAAARAHGFGRVVAASLGLHRALAAPDPEVPIVPSVRATRGPSGADRGARGLTEVCLAALDRAGEGGGMSRSERRRAVRVATADLAPLRRAGVRSRHALRPFGRHASDFVRLPLPARWHAAYVVLRPVLRVLRGPFAGTAGRVARPPRAEGSAHAAPAEGSADAAPAVSR